MELAKRPIDELSLLSNPFQSRLHQCMGSLNKKRIVLNWPKDKERIQRRLYKEDVHSDTQFLQCLADYFGEIKPILIQSYREEYPQDIPTPAKLKGWMEDCAIAANLLGRKKERNVWLEMIRAIEWLMEEDLFSLK